jgi:hypothetical protein
MSQARILSEGNEKGSTPPAGICRAICALKRGLTADVSHARTGVVLQISPRRRRPRCIAPCGGVARAGASPIAGRPARSWPYRVPAAVGPDMNARNHAAPTQLPAFAIPPIAPTRPRCACPQADALAGLRGPRAVLLPARWIGLPRRDVGSRRCVRPDGLRHPRWFRCSAEAQERCEEMDSMPLKHRQDWFVGEGGHVCHTAKYSAPRLDGRFR